jgi:uncharacterized protein YprB with RNaseH-like and TPR domain
MLREALAHLPGVGPETLKLFAKAGIRNWTDLVQHPHAVPVKPRVYESILNEIFRCDRAVSDGDIAYLVKTFEPQDHWRILGHWFDRAAFFDIETEGVEAGSPITVIACYHKGELATYVQGESLDLFLEQLDEIELLVSFNGSSFDVPRVTRHFNIPSIPCPHVDLRWLCYHGGHEGGLKLIERALGIERPEDLRGVDGKDAELLWKLWWVRSDDAARRKLLRYCAADTVALRHLAIHLLRAAGCSMELPPTADLWKVLDTCDAEPESFQPPPGVPVCSELLKLQKRWTRMRELRRGTSEQNRRSL